MLDVEIGEEEVVVDDDELGLHGLAAHRGDEAGLEVGAGLAEADFAAGVELGPQRGVLGQGVHLGAVAGVGMALPLEDGVELLDVVEPGKDRVVAQGVELLLAKVVGAALHDGNAQRAEQRLEERDVLERELLLQILGAGGDDDALAGFAREAQGGQQVGQGLARAGAGFHDKVAAVFEGLLDGLGHGDLAGALLEVQRGAGKQAAGREEVVQ